MQRCHVGVFSWLGEEQTSKLYEDRQWSPNMLFNIKCQGKLSSRDFYSPIRHKKEEPATFTEQLRIEMTSLSPLFINLASLIYEPLLHSYLDENYKTTFVDESAVCPCGQGGQWCPRVHQEKCGQQVEGGDPALYSALGRP